MAVGAAQREVGPERRVLCPIISTIVFVFLYCCTCWTYKCFHGFAKVRSDLYESVCLYSSLMRFWWRASFYMLDMNG